MSENYMGYALNDHNEPCVEVPVSRRVLDDLIILAELGCFGLDVEDVTRRLIDEQVRRLTKEGWLPMPGDEEADDEDDSDDDEDDA